MPKEKENKKKKTGITAKTAKAIVKEELDKRIENKCTNIDSGESIMYNALNASFAPIVLTPSPSGVLNYNITQGTTQSTRVGNKVNVKSAVLKVIVYPLEYDETLHNVPKPNYVRMDIFGMKPQYDTYNNVLFAINPVNGTFFQDGSTSNGYQSLLRDLLSDINLDVVTPFYKRVLKIGCANYAGSGNQIIQNYYANNDFDYSSFFTIDITNHFPKKIIWNDSTNVAASRGVYMTLVPCHADGSVSIDTQLELAYEVQLDLEYEDA